jgi:hypothetical protein
MKALHNFAAIYETRLIESEDLSIVASPVKVDVLTGPTWMYRLSNYQAVVPFKGELDEEVEIPPPPAIDFEPGKRYIIVSTRTHGSPATSEEDCRRIVDRITGILSVLVTPTLFSMPIYVGWVSATPSPPLATNVMFSRPTALHRKNLEKGITVARAVLAKDAAMRDRFDLISRLFARSIGSPPSDEAFLWSWMCLEIFPMLGTQKYRYIAPYLSGVTGYSESELLARFDIRGLHILRSKLVHSGRMGLAPTDLYAKLTVVRGIVYTVMRGMCGLPYDGELERVTSAS